MQNLAVLSKQTKQGVSVWRFVQTDDGAYFAFGGITPACKQFDTIEQLRSCYKSWVRYGYAPGIVEPKKVATPKPVRVQKSQLPADLRSDLWALQPSVA